MAAIYLINYRPAWRADRRTECWEHKSEFHSETLLRRKENKWKQYNKPSGFTHTHAADRRNLAENFYFMAILFWGQCSACLLLVFHRPRAARGPCVSESRNCAGANKLVAGHKFEMTWSSGVMWSEQKWGYSLPCIPGSFRFRLLEAKCSICFLSWLEN
jgi:hypothetical protein